MSISKDIQENSEGEEMEYESGKSDKSSFIWDSIDEASDSDDSSRMDEEESIENLVGLERQFTAVREQLCCERVVQVDTKLGDVKCGRAQEYLQPQEELHENMRIRTEVAGILSELHLTNVRHKYGAEELAAKQNYESEKCLRRNFNHGDLEDKISQPEEDMSDSLSSSRKKPARVSGPYIVYMLKDADILEDWTIIKNAHSAPK